MQEKVSFTPPEIKMFEGKTPPTSWFNQNIVRYYEVVSHSEFLTGFLAYVKQLQSEQVAKTIPQAVEKEPQPLPMPEKATAENVSNTLIFNALQPNIKSEIESLEKLIVILQQANPKLVQDLNQLLMQIKNMARSFPSLNEEQLNFLPKTMKQLDQFASKLPLSLQRKYWEKQFNMLYEIWEDLDQFIKNAQNEVNQQKKGLINLEELHQGLQNIGTLLSKKGGQSFTTAELEQLLAFLQNALSAHSKLDNQGQAALKNFLQQFAGLSGTNGKSLSATAGSFILKQWIAGFLKSHPDATPAQLKKYIQNLLDESDLGKTSLPAFSDIKEEMEQTATKPRFPFTEGTAGVVLAQDQNGKIILNKNFDKELENAFVLNPQSTANVLGAREPAQKHVKEAVEKHKNTVTGYGQAIAGGAEMKASVGKAGATAAGNSGLSGSLPNEFRQAILGHYMPMQEQYLLKLAELLYFANFGAEMGNVLLNKMLDFSEAANNYDFSNFLHTDTSGQFTGSYADAKGELANEQNQCQNDLNKVQSLLNYISQEINKINSQPQLTGAQKTQLINDLKGYKANLQMAQTQLTNLQTTLNSMTVHQGSDANHFTVSSNISNWQTQLSTQENLVINGAPATTPGAPTGGLLTIQSSVQADQQAFSDQSQNQQMMLQMRMTEIQQEWTVVSDSLQALNQMYMQCAKAIYQ